MTGRFKRRCVTARDVGAVRNGCVLEILTCDGVGPHRRRFTFSDPLVTREIVRFLCNPRGSEKPAIHRLILAPRAGFEPATNRLTAGCSTAELPGTTRASVRL